MGLHIVNTLVCMLNLTGKEVSCCSSNILCGFGLYELGMLIFMQITYFTSQDNFCLTGSPDLYFWMMAQILV